jgi:hypothetical protein
VKFPFNLRFWAFFNAGFNAGCVWFWGGKYGEAEVMFKSDISQLSKVGQKEWKTETTKNGPNRPKVVNEHWFLLERDSSTIIYFGVII